MWATSLRRSTTYIDISDWQMHPRPAGDNAGNVIASFCSSSWPSIQLSILSNVSFNHLKNKANLRDLIAATGLAISNWIQIVNFCTRVTMKFDG